MISARNRDSHTTMLSRLLIASLILLLFSCDGNSTGTREFTVSHVIDGDTVVLDDRAGTHLRYLGIDAPEKMTIDTPSDPFGKESTEFNRKLVEGKKVKVEFDKEKYDSYGRLLGYVYVNGSFVNEIMLERGMAHLLLIEPNKKYEDVLKKAQSRAVSEGNGIWNSNRDYNLSEKNERFLIKPVNAKRHIDQRVVVRGKISDVRSNKHVIKLNMEDELDIVVFKNNIKNFRHLQIEPSSYYTGVPVEVTGTITMYRGRAQIIVDHPISLRKLE